MTKHDFARVKPIGYAVVQLVKREKNILTVKNLDAIDKTPVLNIKPYIPEVGQPPGHKNK